MEVASAPERSHVNCGGGAREHHRLPHLPNVPRDFEGQVAGEYVICGRPCHGGSWVGWGSKLQYRPLSQPKPFAEGPPLHTRSKGARH